MTLLDQYKYYIDHKIELGALAIQYAIANKLATWQDDKLPHLTNEQLKEVIALKGQYGVLTYKIWTSKWRDDLYHIVVASTLEEACTTVFKRTKSIVRVMYDFTDKSLHKPLQTFCGGDIQLNQIKYDTPFYVGLYDKKQQAIRISSEIKKELGVKKIYGGRLHATQSNMSIMQ